MRNVLIAAATFLLFGCGSLPPANDSVNSNITSAGTAQSPTPSTPTTANSSAGPDAARPDEGGGQANFEGTAGITEKKNPAITGVAIMSAVRTATHDGYDRMVFEFLGAEMSGYHIEYIDKPVRACGSGNVVQLAGDGWLEVRFTDAQAHAPEGDATIKDRSRSPYLPIVKDLKITCDFEAEVTWVAGVASPNKYRVIGLENPTRLVVDIKHR